MVNLETKIRSININGVFKAPLHYTHATVIPTSEGYFLELSGMIGFDEYGKLVNDNTKDQTLKTIDNIAKVIAGTAKEYGITLSLTEALNTITTTRADVVNLTQNGKQVNEAYVQSKIPTAARTMVGVAELPLNAVVEITARAYVRKHWVELELEWGIISSNQYLVV